MDSIHANGQIAGLDLAKRVFQVHLADSEGHPLSKHRLSRADLPQFFSALSPVTVAMEACTGAHYWAAQFREMGHVPVLLPPRAVAALRTGPKNDAADAALIALAARLPEIRRVPWKCPEQQVVRTMHRVRELLRTQKIAVSNQILALLAELGEVRFPGMAALLRMDMPTFASRLHGVPSLAQTPLIVAWVSLRFLSEQEILVDKGIRKWHASNADSQRAATVPGIGYLTASALASSFGSGSHLSGRQFAASLGLVPVQHSSGEMTRLGHIGRGGDTYLRRLLVTAALGAIMRSYRDHRGPACLVELLGTKPMKVAACAHANRLARVGWAVIASGARFVEGGRWQTIEFQPAPSSSDRRRMRSEGVE